MKFQRLARWLLPWALRVSVRRPPDFRVVKKDGLTYLRRWWIIRRNNWVNLYLHNMILDDDKVLHDHPYWSVSFILGEGLREVYQEDPPDGPVEFRYPRPGDVVLRSSRFAHQLQVLPGANAWTLFLTGPRIKSWGFWCPKGFVDFQKYVSRQETAGAGTGTSGAGPGCGED